MFYKQYKDEALLFHERRLDAYKMAYQDMSDACDCLYNIRVNAVILMRRVEEVVNSIAHTPKEFVKHLGNISYECVKFKESEEYAGEAYDNSVKAGVTMALGVVAGASMAAITPSTLKRITTTFGVGSTSTAVSALASVTTKKTATTMVSKTFAQVAINSGSGILAEEALLALAGPVGLGITTVTTALSLISISNKNRKIGDKVIDEAVNITKAKMALQSVESKIRSLYEKILKLYEDISRADNKLEGLLGADYESLSYDEQLYLGTLVNNTLSLAELLNTSIE